MYGGVPGRRPTYTADLGRRVAVAIAFAYPNALGSDFIDGDNSGCFVRVTLPIDPHYRAVNDPPPWQMTREVVLEVILPATPPAAPYAGLGGVVA